MPTRKPKPKTKLKQNTVNSEAKFQKQILSAHCSM
jgi:16S rRNA C967 or C1407 C5-methylase (RsmB/RsmF family)